MPPPRPRLRRLPARRDGPGGRPTTARPPARGLTLEQAAAGVRDEVHQRTALHDRHLALGATMEPAGAWRRPRHYGDALEEYWAVRRGVSVMDVGTLGKFLVAGPDALAFLERLYPCRIADLEPGRLRYALLLGEHGFVVDDGLVCALGGGRWYLTFTSSGAATAEATLRDWAETWGHEVHIVDLTAAWGAINVAGPRARELLQRLTGDPLDNDSFPYLRHRDVTVAGVPCRALRLGFVGELSYELHHPAGRSVELWDALLREGGDLEHPAARTGRAAAAPAGEGPHHRRAGHRLRRDAGEARDGLGGAAREALVRRQARRRAGERARAAAPARRGRLPRPRPAGGRAARRPGPERRLPLLVGLVARPRVRRVARLGHAGRRRLPGEVESDGTTGSVVAEPFYDPEGERLRA